MEMKILGNLGIGFSQLIWQAANYSFKFPTTINVNFPHLPRKKEHNLKTSTVRAGDLGQISTLTLDCGPMESCIILPLVLFF
jgi:hypothetical protein